MNKPVLPHNPGAISMAKIAEAQTSVGPVEDIITATIVGADPRSGSALVRDISGNTYTVEVGFDRFSTRLGIDGRSFSPPALVVNQQVIISRSRSTKGERTLRLIAIVPLGRTPQDIMAGLGDIGNINDLCQPSQTAAAQGGFNVAPPAPDNPSEPQVPPPPLEPLPQEPPADPPSKPPGCDPGDDTQWYNGTTCPAGMTSLGFAELPGGAIMTLCQGAGGEPGDGCPVTPDTYGFACTPDGCQYVPNGTFLTLEECQANCNPVEPEPEVPLKFSCTPAGCVADSGGTFATLAECEAGCGWSNNGTACVRGPGGTFSTQTACDLASGYTPGQLYQVRVRFDWRTSIPFHPGAGSTVCPGPLTVNWSVWPDPGVKNAAVESNTYTLAGPISFDVRGDGVILINHQGGQQVTNITVVEDIPNGNRHFNLLASQGPPAGFPCSGWAIGLPTRTDIERTNIINPVP